MRGGGLFSYVYAYFWWLGDGVGKAPKYAYVIYEWSKRESHEKLHGEIMDILSIPEGNLFFNEVIRFFHQFDSRFFPLIFLSLNSFKKYLS